MNSHQFHRRDFLKTIGWGVSATLLPGVFSCQSTKPVEKPNIIIIMADDQGYADAGCYGAEGFETPHLDKLAAEGIQFTDFYVGAPVCTPSRAALMTGCYPQRVSLPHVLGPNADTGIHAEEEILAELLQARGYKTACVGKWHLGDQPEFLPTRHGFDTYFGLPYSNDMWPNHPTHPFPDLPLIEGDQIIEYNPDQSQLTTWYTERTVQFIKENKTQPFFIYLPHSMPHVPLFVSDKFKGKSKQGLYGDVIMELDWSVGQIMQTLQAEGLDEKTLIIYLSDNGPWLSYGNHAGSAKPLREGKATTFDGGQRVICLMRWPGQIPAGQVRHEMITQMDLLPTVLKLTGASLPAKAIDGSDIWPLMSNQSGAKPPHDAFYYYNGYELQAVRSGKWKLHRPHAYRSLAVPGENGMPGKYETKRTEFELYNLEVDVSEQNNVAPQHPEIVEKLKLLMDAFEKELLQNRRVAGKIRREGLYEYHSEPPA